MQRNFLTCQTKWVDSRTGSRSCGYNITTIARWPTYSSERSTWVRVHRRSITARIEGVAYRRISAWSPIIVLNNFALQHFLRQDVEIDLLFEVSINKPYVGGEMFGSD